VSERRLDRDVAIVGAGVVGAAIARELTRFELRVTLLEAGPDVGAATSKANTAIAHRIRCPSPERSRRAWWRAATSC
jgi:L-2-hydroxyglutarate oxidase LhgO